MSEIGTIEFVFLLLLLFIAVFGVLAEKLKTPYPIIMVLGGLVLSFVPGIPSVRLNPDLIFLVVLPPLLYSASWNTSWRDFRFNLASILLLAVGLVGFTVVGVAIIAPRVFAGFDWRLGLVLGAVVAPTDSIAATSIARRVGLPSRIVDILEGESLVNDATGLLALEFATGIAVSHAVPTIAKGFATFLWLIVAGIVIGLVGGWLVLQLERWVDDGPIEILLSILAPYAVYLSADSVNASGVLAVVACGLFLSRQSAHFFSPAVRLQVWSVWSSLTYVLNGLMFVLIGLQLPAIRASIHGYKISSLIFDGLVFSVLLISLRLIWVYPGAGLAYFIRKKFDHQNQPYPGVKSLFIVGWTGMRGVLSLAAAIALPDTLPQREIIIMLTFSVILVTLVLQGITLPPLIRALGLAGAGGPNCEEQEARRIVIEAAVAHLVEARSKDGSGAAEPYGGLILYYKQRLASLEPASDDKGVVAPHVRYFELVLQTLRVERQTAISLRNTGRINDEVLRRIERELDLTESRFLANE